MNISSRLTYYVQPSVLFPKKIKIFGQVRVTCHNELMSKIQRRKFIAQTAAVAAFPAVLVQKGEAAKAPASERVRVGMIGAAGRGGSLNRIFSRNKKTTWQKTT